MPTPIIPNLTVSLGALGFTGRDWGSSARRTVLAAIEPPAAAAPISRNSRLEKLFFDILHLLAMK
jgi:hypothetical protein